MNADEKKEFVKGMKKRLKRIVDESTIENVSSFLMLELQTSLKDYLELQKKKEEKERIEDKE